MITPVEYYAMRLQHRIEKLVAVAREVGYCTTENFKNSSLHNTSLEWLGAGVYATAYTLLGSKDIVVKRFPVKSEDGYPEYLKWVLERQDCPYVPKIYKVQQINKNFYIYMKRYNEDVNSPVAADVYSTVGQSHRTAGDLNFTRLNKYGAEFVAFMKELCESFKDYEFDLHLGNIMFDEDGTPVITDPITTKRQKKTSGSFECNLKIEVDYWIKEMEALKYQRHEEIPCFKMKDLVVPKRQPVLDEKPIWQKGLRWV